MTITTSNAYELEPGDKIYRMGNTSNGQELKVMEWTVTGEVGVVNGKLAIPAKIGMLAVTIDESLINTDTLYTTLEEVEQEYAAAF